MIDFSKIKLDASIYPEVFNEVKNHYNFNDGCILHKHWIKDSAENFDIISATGEFASLSWMGNGYPNKSDYQFPFEKDIFKLHREFSIVTRDTIDIQSGMYQFYRLEDLFATNDFYFLDNAKDVRIIEIGGGYGRLAMFFLLHFGERCHYVNIDFAPTSLTFSPQVIKQLFPNLKVGGVLNADGLIEDYNYVSLPAWDIDRINPEFYDLGVNIHSFQEMENRSVRFYVEQLARTISPFGFLYVINNPPEKNNWYTTHDYYGLEKYFEDVGVEYKYPIGADWGKICGVDTLERMMVPKK